MCIFKLQGHRLFYIHIKTDDFYSDIRDDVALKLDTSEYSNNNIFLLPILNKKVIGMMKDENKGNIMLEFVGLRSKMYSLTAINLNEVKKSKGVKKSAVAKLSINDYRKCLFERKIVCDDMLMFRSVAHQLYTYKLNKIVLSPEDDKRKIMED